MLKIWFIGVAIIDGVGGVLYVEPGDLVFSSGYIFKDCLEEVQNFMLLLHAHGAAALCMKEQYFSFSENLTRLADGKR